MRIENNLYGTSNGKEISQDVYLLPSSENIETIKKAFVKKHLTQIKENIEDVIKHCEKIEANEKVKNEMLKFIIEQYKNFNIYKIEKIKENSVEYKIIEIEKEIKDNAIKNLNDNKITTLYHEGE